MASKINILSRHLQFHQLNLWIESYLPGHVFCRWHILTIPNSIVKHFPLSSGSIQPYVRRLTSGTSDITKLSSDYRLDERFLDYNHACDAPARAEFCHWPPRLSESGSEQRPTVVASVLLHARTHARTFNDAADWVRLQACMWTDFLLVWVSLHVSCRGGVCVCWNAQGDVFLQLNSSLKKLKMNTNLKKSKKSQSAAHSTPMVSA